MYEGDVLCLAGVRRPTVSSTVGLLSHLQVASAIEALTSLTDLRLQHSKFKAQATIVASLFSWDPGGRWSTRAPLAAITCEVHVHGIISTLTIRTGA